MKNKNISNEAKSSKNSNPAFSHYTVKEGDDLWKIAEQAYGSGFNAFDIAKANNIDNPEVIYENQVLNIPKVNPKNPTLGETSSLATGQVTVTTEKYVVKQGDELYKIAQSAYGDGNMMYKIAAANNIPNIDNLEVGTVLVIPR